MADDPWDVSGPLFIGLYIAGFIVAVIISVVVRRRFWGAAVPPPSERLSLNELAFLSGGMNLMIDAAIARLVEGGAVRVQRDGTLHATGTLGKTDLDWEILKYVRKAPVTADGVRRGLREHHLAEQTKIQLLARKLLHVETGCQRFLVVLPLLVLLVIGAVRFANGIALDRPVGYLMALLIVTLVTLLARLSLPEKYKRSKSGVDLVERAKRLGPAETSRVLPVAALAGAAGLVVLGGLQAFPDPDIAVALGPSAPAGSAGSSSSCGSSGSSCGGSGCGGGGCGG